MIHLNLNKGDNMITDKVIERIHEAVNPQTANMFGRMVSAIIEERGIEDAQRFVLNRVLRNGDKDPLDYIKGGVTRDFYREMYSEYVAGSLPSSNLIEHLFGSWKRFRIALFEFCVRYQRRDILTRRDQLDESVCG